MAPARELEITARPGIGSLTRLAPHQRRRSWEVTRGVVLNLHFPRHQMAKPPQPQKHNELLDVRDANRRGPPTSPGHTARLIVPFSVSFKASRSF